MGREGIESELQNLTKQQRKAIAQLGSEWTVLDSTERHISTLVLKHYEQLQPGTKRPPELVELESQQREIFERKRKISVELAQLEEGLRPRRHTPGKKKNPVVVIRNMLIRRIRDLPNKDICTQLDFELTQRDPPPMGLPESWTEKYGVTSYSEAYEHENCKALVQKLISVAKARH
jgi:hypothetical protein